MFNGPESAFRGSVNKINHLIELTMENRSFDHFLGYLTKDGMPRVDGLPDPLPTLSGLHAEPIMAHCMDGADYGFEGPPHEWEQMLESFDGGNNDGFVRAYQQIYGTSPNFSVPMGYYTKQTIPVYDALAREFTLCDRWFGAVLGSTWPNRKYMNSGVRDDDRETQTVPPFPGFRTTPIFDEIEDAFDEHGRRLTWRCYVSDLPFLAFWYPFALSHISNFPHIHQFVTDCREDNLPTISIIDPPFQIADDHPPSDPRLGQKFVGLIVDALTHSDSWRDSALIITYDESGGFYDHVPPPQITTPEHPEDDRLGFRVPALIISPYSMKAVSHTPFTHTSIIKSISERWGVQFDGRFGQRWKDSNGIWGCLDFSATARQKDCYTGDPREIFAMNWAKDIQGRLTAPATDFERYMERIFILPELKALDRRSVVFDNLSQLEQNVITLKRATIDATPHVPGSTVQVERPS
jgi:phospholipase C